MKKKIHLKIDRGKRYWLKEISFKHFLKINSFKQIHSL